ncbi:T9SS C-terminal target domain-containing protein [Cyclobacteriaceae bacterium YHN15]|nr:T9SS C-terminal target domain-containing protein [Cyclobacteriaceae bacterium YHN15]
MYSFIPSHPTYLRYLILLSLLLLAHLSFAQNCPQNNLNVAEVYFFDTDGTPFTEDMEFTPGTVVEGQIFVQFGGSANNAYSLFFAYDLIVNDVVIERTELCLFQGTNVIKDKPQYITDFSLTWGDKVEFGNIFMRWYTNPSPDCPSVEGSAAQCYANPGTFRVNTPIIPLPVIWQDFSVKKSDDGQSHSIRWSTAKEWDTSHFEIERAVGGVDEFEVIGEVTSVGWSDKLSSYSYLDPKIPGWGGRVYYRIKQVDLDGSYDFSPLLMIQSAENSTSLWNAYPNPISDNELKISYAGKKREELIQVRIYSMSSIFSASYTDPGTQLDLSHAIKNLPKGVMIVEITTKDYVESIKVVKK